MKHARDVIGAAVLLAGFIVYGLHARDIALFPGQETEAFTPRTLPYVVAIAGALLCVVRAMFTLRRPDSSGEMNAWSGWARVAAFCAFMLGYSVLLVELGFVVATILFLAAGFAMLGERRPLMLTVLPVVFTLAFWLLMSQVLGLYLAPGELWVPDA